MAKSPTTIPTKIMITKGKCKCCLNSNNLVRHHLAYKKYGAEKDEIIILCKDCHNFLHKFIKGSDKDIKRFTRSFIKCKKWWV